MICLAIIASDASDSAHGDGAEAEQQMHRQIDLYREQVVQCLILGEWTKGGPHALETIIQCVYAEFLLSPDAGQDVWFLQGLAVNLAMRMGYHRDPSHFPDMSPLKMEMRRRLWATVLMGDVLVCSQMGLPRMISDRMWDTAEPRNLNDEDLRGDMAELPPPPRPETEHTTALGIVARRRMLVVLGTISDLTAAPKPCSYAEVMRVDSLLHKTADNIPPPLRMKSMAASITDSAQAIMSRLFIRHMLYKGQIMLHRRYLYTHSHSHSHSHPHLSSSQEKEEEKGRTEKEKEKQDPYGYSRTTCLDASLNTLELQHVLDEATRPGGQLHVMRWRVTSSMNHQFLTATMVLCSLVHRGQTLNREGEIMAALRRARAIVSFFSFFLPPFKTTYLFIPPYLVCLESVIL